MHLEKRNMNTKKDYTAQEMAIAALDDDDNIKLKAIQQLKSRKRREIGSFQSYKVRLGLCSSSKFTFDTEIKVEEEAVGILAYVTDEECKLDNPNVPNLRFVPTFRILTCERV